MRKREEGREWNVVGEVDGKRKVGRRREKIGGKEKGKETGEKIWFEKRNMTGKGYNNIIKYKGRKRSGPWVRSKVKHKKSF